MSSNERVDMHHFIQPFTFNGWDGRHLVDAKPDFAESRAAAHSEMAATYQSEGKLELAEEENRKAQWWLDLLNMLPPSRGAYALDFDLSSTAEDALLALLARAQVSKDACQSLNILTYRLLEGLNTLAANGNEDIADTLFSILYRGVDDFNMLAHIKPEIFRKTARKAAGMPGIVTTHPHKIKDNNTLFEKLEAAQDNHVSIFRPGATARYSTLANAWALRLIHHIETAQLLFAHSPPSTTDVEIMVSNWVFKAVQLQPLSSSTWQEWFGVGWEIIMEASSNEPEKEPRLRPIGESASKKQPKYGNPPSERT